MIDGASSNPPSGDQERYGETVRGSDTQRVAPIVERMVTAVDLWRAAGGGRDGGPDAGRDGRSGGA